MSEPDPIFGLDVGTSKCVAGAVDQAGWPRILSDPYGRKIIPSVVSFHPDGHVLVGEEAARRRAEDPRHTIAHFSRLVGRAASSREVLDAASRSPWQFRVGPDDTALLATRAGDVSITDVLGILIDHMRRLAEQALDSDTRRCVLSVPALYDEAQRKALLVAAGACGLAVEGVVDDPVAAALAYGYSRATQPVVAVYDFGGGKFECTILAVAGGDARVLGTHGDTFLGGDDVDVRVLDYTIRAFWQTHRVDLRADELAPARILEAAERAKIELSAKAETILAVPQVAIVGGKAYDLSLTLSREVFAQATEDLVRRTFAACGEACRAAGVPPAQVGEVLLIGGMTKLPWVRDQVTAFFGKPPRSDVNADVGVALGAALWGARLRGQAMPAEPTGIKKRVTAQFGSDAQQAQPSAAIADPPTGRTRVGRISTKKMFTAVMAAVSPEAVTFTPPQLTEVMASRLAISTVGGWCEEVIGKDAALPAEKTRVFTTGKDDQRVVSVQVCQGDSRRFAENVALGTIVLDGLPPRPRGQVRIAVTFAIDTEGVLVALARDEETGRSRSVRIQLARGAGAG